MPPGMEGSFLGLTKPDLIIGQNVKGPHGRWIMSLLCQAPERQWASLAERAERVSHFKQSFAFAALLENTASSKGRAMLTIQSRAGLGLRKALKQTVHMGSFREWTFCTRQAGAEKAPVIWPRPFAFNILCGGGEKAPTTSGPCT